MAIINSIAIGKGSGKLGNIVFQTYHGITIARQKNETISTPPTDAQKAVRIRCENCNSAYSFLKNFLANWTNQGKDFESLWNTFYRLTVNSYSPVRPFQSNRTVNSLINLDLGKPNHLHIDSIVLKGTTDGTATVRVNFTPLAYEFQEDLTLYIVTKQTTGGHIIFQQIPISILNWQDKFMDIEFELNYDFISGAYAQHPRGFSDNLAFSDYITLS